MTNVRTAANSGTNGIAGGERVHDLDVIRMVIDGI